MESLVDINMQDLSDTRKNLSTIEHSRSAKRGYMFYMIVELLLFPILALLPVLILNLSFDFEKYDIWLIKASTGGDLFREYERWVYFTLGCFLILILCEMFFFIFPHIIFGVVDFAKLDLQDSKEFAISSFKYASKNISKFVAFLLIFNFSTKILFDSSSKLAAIKAFSKFSKEDQDYSQSLLFGQKSEEFMAAIFSLLLFIAIEKYIISIVRASFYRVGISHRVRKYKDTLEVIEMLNLSSQNQNSVFIASNTISEIDQNPSIAYDHLDSTSVEKAAELGNQIFDNVCPLASKYITATDLKPFSGSEYLTHFSLLDIDKKDKLSRGDLVRSVMSIFDEHRLVTRALESNSKIVAKLDNVLFGFFFFMGALFGLIIYEHMAFTWLTSMGSFILGFSFLFATTVNQIFNAFSFVFIQHAFDAMDHIKVNSSSFIVQNIDIFTTVMKTNDGSIVYAPNNNLKSSTIYNSSRIRTSQDVIFCNINCSSHIKSLSIIQKKLSVHFSEEIEEFTGKVDVNIIKFTGQGQNKKANLKIRIQYQIYNDFDKSKLTQKKRKDYFLQQLSSICKENNINIDLKN